MIYGSSSRVKEQVAYIQTRFELASFEQNLSLDFFSFINYPPPAKYTTGKIITL